MSLIKVRKWQCLITLSTESNHKGEGGGQKTQNLDYVIHGWSLGGLTYPQKGQRHFEQN